jgi:hypothetical protein
MTYKHKQTLVSQTVWPWQEDKASGKPQKPSLATAFFTLTVAWVVAGVFYYFSHPVMATIVACISMLVFFCSQFLPDIYSIIERLIKKLSRGIGLLLTWLTLAPFFYLCFGGGRIIQKITGKDPMNRNIESSATTYWLKRKEGITIKQYRKQF